MSEAPDRIGKYRILRRLGQGAQGAIYLAQRDFSAGLSVVKQRHAAASDLRFRREAQVCALLDHRNIAKLEAAVFEGDEAYLAFEYVAGVEVQDIYNRHRQLGRSIPTAIVAHILDGMLAGLEAAHEALDASGAPAGLVHRDLNFGNVMLGFDGIPKIIDFGLARSAAGDITQPGYALGTPAYMPPEFLGAGAQSAVPASDVYSAGLIAYDLLAGIDADVSRGDSTNFWTWIMNPTPLPRLSEVRKDITPILGDTIHRAFQPRIADRWPSARAFLDAVRAALPASQRLTDAHAAQYLAAGFKERQDAYMSDVGRLIHDTPLDATGVQQSPLAASSPGEDPATTLVVNRRSSNPPGAKKRPSDPVTPAANRLGRYALLRPLAEGGMGQVYLARRDGSESICVLKTLRNEVVKDEISRKRFIREAQVAAYLDHPNIAKLLDAGFEDGTFCIAFEFIPGKDLESMLHTLMAQRRLLPFPVSISAMIGVLDGLDYAHQATDPAGKPLGLVHRDLSPRNMMLGFDGTAKVIDFGVARASLDDFKTAPGMVMGTFRYVSPEMARAEALDRRSDIYASGVVLYELLSGVPVVMPSAVAVDMLRSVVAKSPDPLGQVNTQIPASLSAAVMRAIEKRQADRWQTAAEFRSAIVAAVPEWAQTPRPVLSDFLRTWFREDAERSAAIVELSGLGEVGERTRTFVLGEDAVEATAVVPMAAFAEVEEALATKTGLVFPEAPEATRSVMVERTKAAPTRIIDARSQPDEAAVRRSAFPAVPAAGPSWKTVAVGALAGSAVTAALAGVVIWKLTSVPTVQGPIVVPVASPAASPVPSAEIRVVAEGPGVAASPVPASTTPSPTRRPQPTPTAPGPSARPSPNESSTSRSPTSRGDPELVALAARLRSSSAEPLARDPAFPRFVERATELASQASGDAKTKAMRKIAMLQMASSVEAVDAVVVLVSKAE